MRAESKFGNLVEILKFGRNFEIWMTYNFYMMTDKF